MPRKSSITRAPEPLRAAIDTLLRKDSATLDEILDLLREQFPEHADAIPSRSALGRYKQANDVLVRRMREQDAAARAVVAELGENPDERAGAYLTQTLTALTTHVVKRASVRAEENDDAVSIGEIKDLARATRNVMDARRVGLKERMEIEQAARDRMQREQQAALQKMQKKGLISKETLATIRREIYGRTEAPADGSG